MKSIKIFLPRRCNLGHELLRRLARFLRRNHDRCAVRVVCANPMHFVSLHPLKPHPNVSLDVLHHVAKMELAVGVGQSGGDEDAAVSQSGAVGGHRKA